VIGYPVVLKVSSVDITHKSDAGGVKVNLKDKAPWKRPSKTSWPPPGRSSRTPSSRGIGSENGQAGPGIIIGISKDPSFGPVMMFGLGGILVEVLKDVSFRIVPIENRMHPK